jgi:hypothetical protein
MILFVVLVCATSTWGKIMRKFLGCLLFLLSFCSTFAHTVPVSLVWQANREKAWEEDWLLELLNGVDLNIIDDGKYQTYLNNSIIVITAWQKFTECRAYLKKLHKMNYKFGLIVLSDERYIVPSDIYKNAAFTFRNYWHKKFLRQKNIGIFPLGYKTGFWRNDHPIIKTADQRILTWSFAGQIQKKPTREAMIASLKVFPNYYIHQTAAWADPNALDVVNYRNMLLDSLFVPCPSGWVNQDSYRLYEALECGCIPIVEKGAEDYFFQYFGSHPFISIDSWDQAPALMSSLLANPDLLERRRIQCYEWWQAHKKVVNQQWVTIINQSFH